MKLKHFKKIIISGLTLLSLLSCNNEDINTITAIKLITSDAQLLIEQDFSFIVLGNNSTDITNQAVIKVNGEVIENASFSSSEPGEFEVQAFYKDLESNVASISTVYPSGYIQNVLVEDYTGTWCVNCPRVSWAIEQAKLQSDKVVSVGIHAYDEMEMDGYDVLTTEFGVSAYPTGKINRINTWEFPEDQNIEMLTNLTGYGASLGLSINSEIDGAVINATIDVGFEENVTTPLKIVVYLTENGLVYDQHNSTAYYGGEDPIVDFIHNDVLRAIYTDHLGTSIPVDQTVADNIFSLQIQESIPTTIQNDDQLHLVAFVTNATTKEVINVREVKVGETQELQDL